MNQNTIDMLKEMFDPQAEAAGMELEQITAQVHEMRESEPDFMYLTDEEIAQALKEPEHYEPRHRK